MTDLMILFAGLGGLAAILAGIALRAPQRLRGRVDVLIVAGVLMQLTYFGLTETLGRPKPLDVEWNRGQLDEAVVLGSHIVEGEAIYVWLGIDGADGPRGYALPWNEKTARELHGAQGEAEERLTRVRLGRRSASQQDERQTVFYAEPQPAPPAKERQPRSALATPGAWGLGVNPITSPNPLPPRKESE